MFVFKALNGLVPLYLSENLAPCKQNGALRSSSQLLLQVLRSRCECEGDEAFPVAAPRLWTDLDLSKSKTIFFLLSYFILKRFVVKGV